MAPSLAPALDQCESATGFLEARGVDVKRLRFSTAFGRGFDYYTGLVFELTDPKRTGDPLVAGGRYDGLLARLGANDAIPAVGFAVWIERLAVYGGARCAGLSVSPVRPKAWCRRTARGFLRVS